MRVVWLTDLHLDFVKLAPLTDFFRQVSEAAPDAVLISGDIAESHNVIDHLAHLDDAWDAPIHFVLGNHDFYFGSIHDTRRRVGAFCGERKKLNYLTLGEAAPLTDRVGLVGHDGWADGRSGDYERSLVMMFDYQLIDELSPWDKPSRWNVLQTLGDEAAGHIRRVLPPALDRFEEVWLLTHVPPLREACWHEGRISDDQWAPHFVCLAMGEAVLEIMAARPDRRLVVLCGHTHGRGVCQPLHNVLIRTGGATYGQPGIAAVFDL